MCIGFGLEYLHLPLAHSNQLIRTLNISIMMTDWTTITFAMEYYVEFWFRLAHLKSTLVYFKRQHCSCNGVSPNMLTILFLLDSYYESANYVQIIPILILIRQTTFAHFRIVQSSSIFLALSVYVCGCVTCKVLTNLKSNIYSRMTQISFLSL